MSSVEDRRNSGTAEQQPITGSLNIPGLVTQFSPSDQLSFPDTTSQPFSSSQLMNYPPSPAITRALYDPNTSSGMTRNLAELETGAVPAVRSTTTSLRQPVVYRQEELRNNAPSQGTALGCAVGSNRTFAIDCCGYVDNGNTGGNQGRDGFQSISANYEPGE